MRWLIPTDAANRMLVRDTVDGERRTIARSKWTFSDATHVTMDDGFEPGKIYEVIYQAKDPVVAGLGPAAIRDTVSFFKHGGVETLLADQHQYIKRALGFGVSQSGRFLRTFLVRRIQPGRKERARVRRRLGACGGRGARQLQRAIRAAFARRPSVLQRALSGGYSAVHR